jgi:hypothetical protein
MFFADLMSVVAKSGGLKKEGGGDLTRSDWYKLSFDKEPQQERPLTFKEAKAVLGSRIRREDGK